MYFPLMTAAIWLSLFLMLPLPLLLLDRVFLGVAGAGMVSFIVEGFHLLSPCLSMHLLVCYISVGISLWEMVLVSESHCFLNLPLDFVHFF
jgi:hypothetical protein